MCLGDVARVLAVSTGGSLVVEAEGRTSTVSSLLLDGPPVVGDWVLAHAGHALAVLTEVEAAEARAVRVGMGKGPG